MANSNGRPYRAPGDIFTPTQRRIINLLSDGMGHTKEELHTCLWDDAPGRTALSRHLCYIRRILRPRGEDILCEMGRVGTGLRYRHVRLLKPMSSE